jgi:hypothetical protein
MATDVHEERGVVDDRVLVLVEPDPLAEAQRHQALPQDVLHRLPESEIDAERQSGNELGAAREFRNRSEGRKARVRGS